MRCLLVHLLLLAPRADGTGTCSHRDVVPGWRFGSCTSLDLGLGVMRMTDTSEAAAKVHLTGGGEFAVEVEMHDDEMWQFSQSLSKNKYLAELSFPNVQVGPRGMTALGRALASNTALDSLSFTNAGLTPRHMANFSKHMASNKGVRRLKFTHGAIGEQGARHLGAMLEQNGHLRELELYNQSLNAEGVAAIARGLRENEVLAVLKLDVNPLIGDDGVGEMAQLLAGHRLAGLSLVNVGVTAAGMKTLAAALTTNRALSLLDLRRNGLDNEAVMPIVEMLQSNHYSALTSINMEGNQNITEGMRVRIEALLSQTYFAWLHQGAPGYEGSPSDGTALRAAYSRWQFEQEFAFGQEAEPRATAIAEQVEAEASSTVAKDEL